LILADHLPEALRADLLPAFDSLVRQVQPQGLWLFGSWARGTASWRSDVDLLVLGQGPERLLDAYDAVLEAPGDCPLTLQPLVARGAGRGCSAAYGQLFPVSLESARQRARPNLASWPSRWERRR